MAAVFAEAEAEPPVRSAPVTGEGVRVRVRV